MRKILSAVLLVGSAVFLLAAVEGSAGGLRWTVPARWAVAPPKPMRMATYTVPAAGGEAGECGVFFFGKGQGGSVEDNLSRWEKQFEGGPAPKRSEKTIHGFRVHFLEASGTYTAMGGPMMQPQGKKPGWSLRGAIVEAPDGLVFFKCIGPDAAVKAASKEFDELLESLAKATAKA
ncbi:MAG TPA: hypothetical protein VGH97_06530 [Thermoanaerobaculia bacterium]